VNGERLVRGARLRMRGCGAHQSEGRQHKREIAACHAVMLSRGMRQDRSCWMNALGSKLSMPFCNGKVAAATKTVLGEFIALPPVVEQPLLR
jgi:hypothetical protein